MHSQDGRCYRRSYDIKIKHDFQMKEINVNNVTSEKKTKRLRFYIKTSLLKRINSGIERGIIADKSASDFI